MSQACVTWSYPLSTEQNWPYNVLNKWVTSSVADDGIQIWTQLITITELHCKMCSRFILENMFQYYMLSVVKSNALNWWNSKETFIFQFDFAHINILLLPKGPTFIVMQIKLILRELFMYPDIHSVFLTFKSCFLYSSSFTLPQNI